MMTKLVNLTPHDVNIVAPDGSVILTIAPSGTVARCATSREVVGSIQVDGVDIPVTQTTFGAVEGLRGADDPNYACPWCGYYGCGSTCDAAPVYIVSSLVAQAARGRSDLLVPDDTVRDADGRIIGCRSLARVK